MSTTDRAALQAINCLGLAVAALEDAAYRCRQMANRETADLLADDCEEVLADVKSILHRVGNGRV